MGTTTPVPVSKRFHRAVDLASVFRGGRELPLRWRFLVALLAVIVVAETVLAVTFYNQQKQHSITEQLTSLGQRMHNIADFQFGVAQLALQPSPVNPREVADLRSMLRSSEQSWAQASSAANRSSVRFLEPRFEALAHARTRFDHLPRNSPERAADRGLLIGEARKLMATTKRLHHSIDSEILAAQKTAESRQSDSFRVFLVGSAISLAAAIALALLLARTISRPVARLADGARQLGEGNLDYRLEVGSQDEIGVVAREFNRMAVQLQDVHSTLEDRVQQRTGELAEANKELAKANSELDLHRAEQERLAQQRRVLLSRVISAQEEERQRIARELHDETGQSLTALGLGLEAAVADLRSDDSQGLGGRLRSLAHVASEAIEELDRLVLDLRPAQLDHLGLVATLRWYTTHLRSQAGVATRVVVRGEARRLQSDIETALFRIAQEALTNVARHANASAVEVVLTFEPDLVSLEVKDDGAGFDAEQARVAPSSVGLIGMRERAQLIGGVLAVRSKPGEGTQLSVTVPTEGERS
ncbi:MAG: HAMP domain-containing protein [Solirubrobacterales bacterium]